MNVLAIDPGPEKSGWVVFDGESPCQWGWDENGVLKRQFWNLEIDGVLIEYPKPRGMPTSREEMDTLFEAGRLIEAWGGPWKPIYRQDVKLTLCGHARAKDANIRQALIDYFGGEAKAIGGKKCQRCRNGQVSCPHCKGRGFVLCAVCGGKSRKWKTKTCDGCANVGRFECDRATPCAECDATGYETPPGPLAGISGHCWSALALAVTHKEMSK